MWCTVTITYGPTAYSQNYKRQMGAHDHGAAQALTVAALADSLTKINNHLPAGKAPARQNQLGISNQNSYLPNDPGGTWRVL